MQQQPTASQHIDRRVLRTRKAINNAFDKLIAEKSIDKITVSAIAREADIDRKTFYLHYKSVNDLVSRKTGEILERIADVLVKAGENTTPMERVHISLTELNKILTEKLDLYSNLALSLSTDQVFEYFVRAAEPSMMQPGFVPQSIIGKPGLMHQQFFLAGALSLYTIWLRSDHEQPIETVSNAIEESIATIHVEGAPQYRLGERTPHF